MELTLVLINAFSALKTLKDRQDSLNVDIAQVDK